MRPIALKLGIHSGFSPTGSSSSFPHNRTDNPTPRFQAGVKGTPTGRTEEDLATFQRNLKAEVEAAEKAEFKARILAEDLGEPCLTIGERQFTIYDVLKLVQQIRVKQNTSQFNYIFNDLFPEVVRTSEKGKAFQGSLRILMQHGLLDKQYNYTDSYYFHKEERSFEHYAQLVLSDKGKRVLDEVTQAEVNQAYQARTTKREEEKQATELKQKEAAALEILKKTQQAEENQKKEAQQKLLKTRQKTMQHRALIYPQPSGMTGWELLRNYQTQADKKVWKLFWWGKQGKLSFEKFVETFPESKRAAITQQLNELKALEVISNYYGDKGPIDYRQNISPEQLKMIDPTQALQLKPENLKDCVALDIEKIEQAITERQAQLNQLDMGYLEAQVRSKNTQAQFEKTKAEALAKYEAAQNMTDVADRTKLELDAAKLVQQAENLKLNADAEQQGTETIRVYLEEVRASYSEWHADMQQHIQRRRQMMFQIQTAAIMSDMTGLMKDLSQLESAEATSQQSLSSSLAAVFGDMNANKTTLEANRVLREASQALRSVELAERIKALKGERAGTSEQAASQLQALASEAASSEETGNAGIKTQKSAS
jgi:hypothetical protein